METKKEDLNSLLSELSTLKKRAFTPFPENQLPPILMSPDGQPFIVDPSTNQVSPATPEMLMQMGIDPAQLGMGPPQGGPPQGGAMPPQGGPPPQQGAPPQQGQQEGPPQEDLMAVLQEFDQRLTAIEQTLDQFSQMMNDPDPAAQGQPIQMGPQGGMGLQAAPMGGR